MTDNEQWTSGVLPSDATIGTDDPDEEAAQVEGQLTPDEEREVTLDEEAGG